MPTEKIMFGWLKRKNRQTDTATFVKKVPNVLTQYGQLLEDYPSAYMDETWLPLDKASMKRVLKAGWILAADDEGRKWIESAWTSLSLFQPGVGSSPVNCDVLGGASEENSNNLDQWVHFAKIGHADDEANKVEFLAFVRKQKNNRG
jgi:hypothetical protein